MSRHRNSKVLARFSPRTADDLMPELVKVINAEAVFTYAWQMDEDDPRPGDWVLTTEDKRFGGYWIPESDLVIIKKCDRAEC